MLDNFRNIVRVIGFGIWLTATIYLLSFANGMWDSVAIFIIIITTLLFVCDWYDLYHKNNYYQSNNKILEIITAALAKNLEVVVFNNLGQTIFSTHLRAYPDLQEYLRKLQIRTTNHNDFEKLNTWITEHHEGELTIHNEMQNRWWQIKVEPLLYEKPLVMVYLCEVSNLMNENQTIQQNQKKLEDFLDNAPFAMLYTNKSNQIIGLNYTFAKWLHQEKTKVLGQSISNVLEGLDKEITNALNIVKIKAFRSAVINALLFKPENFGDPLILLKIENITQLCNLGDSSFDTFTKALIPAIILDKDFNLLIYNDAFDSLLEKFISKDEEKIVVGCNFSNFINQKHDFHKYFSNALANSFSIVSLELNINNKKLETTAYISKISNSLSDNKQLIMIQFIDCSEKKLLEQQFIQSQKMQAVGQLAGGVAHDFNNLLTAMIGFCDLLLQRYLPNDPSYMDVIHIKQNANRAANLVKQLLAFSRQQTLQPRVINITDILSELSALLRRLIGANIELKVIHGSNLCSIKADVGQFEQVIINLLVNARDAMVDQGVITIITSNYHNNKTQKLGHELMPSGDYVMIEVIDTGHGIAPENLERIFEPFFSTKAIGSGTGLGLSTVYGIIKQTGGFIAVDSQINAGTTFKIFLPSYQGEEEVTHISNEKPSGDLTGSGTILLVEDEEAVRMFSTRALQEKGYNVISVESGEQALKIASSEQRIDLLITDVVMPKMDGPTLSKNIKKICPNLNVIFISGYTEDTFRKNLDQNTKIYFLPKPFTLKDLASKVKEVFDHMI